MRITSVEFRKLVSTGDYNNVTIGATAVPDATEEEAQSPESALAELRSWVDAQIAETIGDAHEREQLSAQVYQQRFLLSKYRTATESARERFEEVRTALAAHGIEVPALTVQDAEAESGDGIPF